MGSVSLAAPDHAIPSIAVIIPVYNEAYRVGKVLDVVCNVAEIGEIIVVDDGSNDHSLKVAIQAQECDQRIHLIIHSKNLGKGQAIHSGLNATRAELILLLDADLYGLGVQHLQALYSPLVVDDLDMTIGIFRGGKFYSDFGHWATPWLSGQRCLWRERLESISWRAADGYGLETAITMTSLRNKWKWKKVVWRGVSHPPSETHRGVVNGLINRSKMYLQIVRAFLLAYRSSSE